MDFGKGWIYMLLPDSHVGAEIREEDCRRSDGADVVGFLPPTTSDNHGRRWMRGSCRDLGLDGSPVGGDEEATVDEDGGDAPPAPAVSTRQIKEEDAAVNAR
ncbi:hypothetical protein ACLOJK_000177 [Asimina triloba]